MANGRFVVLEGLDGAGITTQTEFLRTWFEKHGIPVAVTKEPSDGPAGAVIKWVLRRELEGIQEESLALLFAADRHHHVAREIMPALKNGTAVICDRYYLSSFAYQLVEVSDMAWLREINSKCPKPDITIFLDVPPSACLERMTSDSWRGLDRLQLYEELSRLEQVRANFLSVISSLQAEGEHIVVVDGSQDIRTVGNEVLAAVTQVTGRLNPSRAEGRGTSASSQIEAILEEEPAAP